MSDWAVIAVRWALFADLGLLFGLPLFALHALGGARPSHPAFSLYWPVILLAIVGVFISALGFALQASAMAGLPVTEIDRNTFSALLNETPLGAALKVRMIALVAAFLLAALASRTTRLFPVGSLFAGALALGTLAWSGHGAADDGTSGWLHLLADVLHLLAAGAWVGALVAFVWLVAKTRQHDALAARMSHRALAGFAMTGSVLVAILVVTGLVNGYFIVGGRPVEGVLAAPYGQLLTLKLMLFVGMLGFAASNRFRLTPALDIALAQHNPAPALQRLRRSLLIELGLAFAILGLVAWLGTLPPVPGA